ncbi:hypothetical protein [Micromonospora sp. NPDC047074]|uniref:hypothetical protein n=1 Tax=Micromonospora sp. NPDC047074 TaxID=3154339 RepID=UPI00340613BD
MNSVRGVVLAAVVLLAGCSTADPPVTRAGTAPSTAAPSTAVAGAAASPPTGCASRVETGRLPEWADAGFSGEPRVPHVLGGQGEIVAILFGRPLTASRRDGANNKILWVAHPAATPSAATSPTTLTITATLHGTRTRVTREVAGGPGPSIVDLPQAGCWHLELRWSGHTDTMDLVYADS